VALNAVNGVWDPSLRLSVLDWAQVTLQFQDRYRKLQKWSREHQLHLVKQHTWQPLVALLDLARRRGWEGVVLRHPRSLYTPGKRNRDLLKLKPASYVEATVVSVETKKHQAQLREEGGTAETTERTFACRWNSKTRERPAPGDVVTVTHYGRTATGLPEFPLME